MAPPPGRTSPPMVQPGISSFIRLSDRRNVDLPQPEGPINAVTCWPTMSRLTGPPPFLPPYETVTSRTVNFGGFASLLPLLLLLSLMSQLQRGGACARE